jgi:metal-dependent amidase/aminoacylase/carboxypeptidase family protein
MGARNSEKGMDPPHRNAKFDFDEDAMVVGAEMMAHVETMYLMNH